MLQASGVRSIVRGGWMPMRTYSAQFNPLSLFSAGEQGFAFVNDLSTMYQDSAGTIPAALEQPLGKWLDVSGRGNHATQPTSANRPTVSARYNKVTTRNANPTDLTGMVKSGDAAAVLSVISDPALIAASGLADKCPSGALYKLDNSLGSTTAFAFPSGFTGNTNAHVITVWAKADGVGPYVCFSVTGSGSAGIPASATLQKVTTAATAADAASRVQINCQAGRTVYFILFDMREACHSNLPTPQVIAGTGSTDYDSAGFPVRVRFNGTNQWMQVGAADFTGTNKMTVLAGVTKLSDAAGAVLVEAGASVGTTAGSFALVAPNGATATFGYSQRGATTTPSAISPATYASPVSAVISGSGDLNAPSTQLRVNGSVSATTLTATGGGNFTANAVYIGARVGANSFLNGDIFTLICRGAATNDPQITQAEQYVNARMGRVY